MLTPVEQAKGNAIDYLEWQVAHGGAGHSVPVARFRAGSAEKSTLKTRALPFTGEITVAGKSGQLFVICAHSVNSEGFSERVMAAESTDTGEVNAYMLALDGTSGELSIHKSLPCPNQFQSQYLFSSVQHLTSDAPFLLVQKNNAKKRASDEAPLFPETSDTNPRTMALLSGGISDTGDHNDFKRPPFMPALDKANFDLLLLPTLNLPANWPEYLPFARVYHWLTDHNPAGLTILVRFNDQPPVRLQISQAECTDMAEHLLSIRQLLNWLAPKLNGREHIVQQLLELLSGEYETVLPEETLEAIQRQLAIVLEQPDTEFSLEFEYSELLRTVIGEEKAQQPPGIFQLGGVQSKTTQSTASTSGSSGQSNSVTSSERQGSSNPQSQPNRLYPKLDREVSEAGSEAVPDAPIDYVIRMHQTKYRISSEQVFAFINTPISQSGLRLFCEDCRQSGIPVEEVTAHAQTHWLTCPQCQQFRPGATTYAGRCNMLEAHTQSQCENFRGAEPVSPPPDDSLTVLRFMFRFGTEDTLLDLLQQPELPITSALLLETDQYRRTLLHDLAQHATESVIRRFMQRYERLMTPGALSIQDNGRNTPLHFLFKKHPESLSLAVINCLGRARISRLLTLQDELGDTLLHILVEQKYFRAFSEILWYLSILSDDSLTRRLLRLQNNTGLSLLHSIFSSPDISLSFYFIDKWARLITPEALAAEASGGETPLHRLFEKEPSPWVDQLIEKFLDRCAMHLSKEFLSKRRRSDGNTLLHLLFAKANPELTRKLLDKCYLHLGREVAVTKNKAGESILQTLLQNSKPATAVAWLHQGNPEHRQIFKDLLDTNPVMEWPELSRRAGVYEASVPQLGWVREALESIDHGVELSIASSAPPLGPLSSQTSQKQQAALSVITAYAQCPVCLGRMQDDCVNTACCHHQLHRSCITRVLQSRDTCPLCKQPTQISQLQTVRMPHIVIEKVDIQKKVAARPEARDKEGRTELHIAVMNGHFDDVLKLIEQGADREAKDNNGYTPLHYAAAYHRTESLGLLAYVYKVDLDVMTKEGNPPLHMAAIAGNEQCIELLIKYGANPDARTNEGATPLHLAAMGKTETAVALIQQGANLEAQDEDGETPLHMAAQMGKTETAVVLIQQGANLEAQDVYEDTPLHYAARRGNTETAMALIQQRANPEAQDKDGRTPLHMAAQMGKTETAVALIQQRANPEAQDKGGRTPLHMAAGMGETETAVALIQQGANLEAQDEDGETPLHMAAGMGETETAVALIQQGANLEAQDEDGETPLHMAARRGNTETAVALAQRGAEIQSMPPELSAKVKQWLHEAGIPFPVIGSGLNM